MKGTRWLVLLLVLAILVTTVGCKRPQTPQVSGVYLGEPDLPDGFLQEVRDVLSMFAEDGLPLESLEIRSAQYLGRYTRRAAGAPFGYRTATRSEDNYLVVVTLEGDGDMKVGAAVIQVGTDGHYVANPAGVIGRTRNGNPPVDVNSWVLQLGSTIAAEVLIGWVTREDVHEFTIHVADGPEFELCGQGHRFFTILVGTREATDVWGSIPFEDIDTVAYDSQGRVIR